MSSVRKEISKVGFEALKLMISKEKNVKIIEKTIKKIVIKNLEKINKNENDIVYEEMYNHILYQTIGDIYNKISLKEILMNLKEYKILWDHPSYKDVTKRLEEQDEFIIHPFEVVEGVTNCKKCGSKRVFTYQKQTRGSDEPSSTFATCVLCNAKWVYSG